MLSYFSDRHLSTADAASLRSDMLARESSSLADLLSRPQSAGGRPSSASTGGGTPRAYIPLPPRRLDGPTLSAIASDALRDAKKEAEGDAVRARSALSTLRAVLLQADWRLAEVKRQAHAFKRAVIEGGLSPVHGGIMSENIVRFFENSIARRNAAITKLSWKTEAVRKEVRNAGAGDCYY
jgi:hypothetical protein